MKPLLLHVEGLHSFRSPCRIDLEDLTSKGLFGVFGPIGSGKSTLLDAMTLALYGRIDRLGNRSRRGIINHQSKRCEVRLRYRVGDEVWEAQRAYSRDKHGAAKRIHSRLARVRGSQIEVVADKEREMNRRVESMVGLSAEDFMRAVVLPQGRFMQFLQLQGADRRRMLQRLFHLEPYGEGLRSRVKQRTISVERDLQRVLGELEGLGSGDTASVDVLTKTVSTSTNEVAEAETQRAEAKTYLETVSEDWARCRAHQSAKESLARHNQDEVAMRTRRETVETAQRARPILSLMDALDHAHTALATRSRELLDAERESTAAVEHQTSVIDVRNELTRERHLVDEHVRRRTTLKRAVDLDAERDSMTPRIKELERNLARAVRRHDKSVEQLQRIDDDLTARAARASSLATELTAVSVDVRIRDRLLEAEAARQRLEEARERAKAVGTTLRDLESELEESKRTLHDAEGALQQSVRRRDRLSVDRQGLEEQATALQPWVDAFEAVRSSGTLQRIRHLTTEVERSESELNRARTRRDEASSAMQELDTGSLDWALLAGVLASRLDGDCPVCGSSDHPRPAKPADFEELQDALRKRATAQEHLRRSVSSVESASDELRTRQGHLQEAEEELPERLRSAHKARSLDSMQERCRIATRHIDRALTRNRQSQDALRPALDDVRALVAGFRGEVASLLSRKRRDLVELKRAQSIEGSAWGQMMSALGDDTLFDLPRRLEELQAHDRRRQEMERERVDVDKEILALRRRRDTLHENVATARSEVRQHETELEVSTRRHRQLQDQLTTLSPGGAPLIALQVVEAWLTARSQQEASAQRDVEEAARRVLQATSRTAAAASRRAEAQEMVTRTDQALASALHEAGRTALPETGDGRFDLDLDQERRRLQRWEGQRSVLQNQVEQAAASVREIVDEDLVRIAERAREQTESTHRDAVERLARSRERLATAKQRSTRHAELTERRGALDQRAAHLTELSRVLRGDRFVEYVANDYLHDLAREATEHLEVLSRGRYALDLDTTANFLIRDLDAGNRTRPATSLSGGETFLASLALALALSTQVQRHNSAALDFFFLDEGFGTLDPEALDRVMSALEELASTSRVIGLISHVEAVRERVPRRLELRSPRNGSGTVVKTLDA